jgi:hypothetical protein
MIFFKRKENDWCLRSALLYLLISNQNTNFDLLFWLGLDFIICGIKTYFTVIFLSSATIKSLSLLLIPEIFE